LRNVKQGFEALLSEEVRCEDGSYPQRSVFFFFLQIDVVAAPQNMKTVFSAADFSANTVLTYITTLEAIVKRKGGEANPIEPEASTGFIITP
jgi:hypothetical protein